MVDETVVDAKAAGHAASSGTSVAGSEEGTGVAVAEQVAASRLNLKVDIQDVGPCKKHISVTIPAEDISSLRADTIADISKEIAVPGFRLGKVPSQLIAKRFKKEISLQLKQKLLMQSLDQVSEDHDLDPINEPELDVENLEVPDEGAFEYEFEVEVRPVFQLPDYSGMTIKRPVREITSEDVAVARDRYLAQFGQLVPFDGPASEGDQVIVNLTAIHKGESIRKFEEVALELRPILRFWDAELEGFSDLLAGCKAGDVKETEVAISREATEIEMRDETVQLKFEVLDVKKLEAPEITDTLLNRIGVDDINGLESYLQNSLERQVSHEQRQKTRSQVLEKITESATWDLPEGLVSKHVENALRREILEMQQAGYSREQIAARQNQIRQQSLSTTQQALKEHFVLDRIAEAEEIETTSDDVSLEIYYMALQQGENPRKLRARLVKSGMMENLEAQIRERKAVDFILSKATFEDEPVEDFMNYRVETLNKAITSTIQDMDEEADELDSEEV